MPSFQPSSHSYGAEEDQSLWDWYVSKAPSWSPVGLMTGSAAPSAAAAATEAKTPMAPTSNHSAAGGSQLSAPDQPPVPFYQTTTFYYGLGALTVAGAGAYYWFYIREP